MSDSATPWYIAIGSTIITALSSALTYLFKLRENENSRRINEQQEQIKLAKTEAKQEIDEVKTELKSVVAKADQCESDRAKLFAECSVLKFEVNTLKSQLCTLGVDMKDASKEMQRIDVDGTKYSHRNDQ